MSPAMDRSYLLDTHNRRPSIQTKSLYQKACAVNKLNEGEDNRLFLKLKEITRNQEIFRSYHTDDIRSVRSLLSTIHRSTGYLSKTRATLSPTLYEYGVLSTVPHPPLTLMSYRTSPVHTLRSRPATAANSLGTQPLTSASPFKSRPITASYLNKTTPLLSPACIRRRARCYNDHC